MRIIDAYAHVSLPRFLSAEEFLGVMDANGVEAAVLSTSDACPDLAELHRAYREHPDRFRVVGLPVGETPEEMLASVRAQMQAGFLGVRMPDHLIATYPELIDPVGEGGGVVLVVGTEGLMTAGGLILDFLDRYPESFACGAQFAGPTRIEIFDRVPSVGRLFAHKRFNVIFSGHGAFDDETILPWAKRVQKLVGWERVLFGSDYPLSLWRDESYAAAAEWIETLKPNVHRKQKRMLLYSNAKRVFFNRPAPEVGDLPASLRTPRKPKAAPVRLFPTSTLDFGEDDQRRVLRQYLAWGGDSRGSYSDFVSYMLTGWAKRKENEQDDGGDERRATGDMRPAPEPD